jgi:hypothetical protein
MDFDDYQTRSAGTNAPVHDDEFEGRIAALLGLGSEVGSLLDLQKKLMTGNVDPSAGAERVRQELGDLLWYLARVATAFGFGLNEIAETNLARSADMWGDGEQRLVDLPELDSTEPAERFPRRLVLRFMEVEHREGELTLKRAQITLLDAEPNDFPDGPTGVGGKVRGYEVGGELGDALTDNSRREDGYRYHDAIHMAFMACLHWSATMRSLLRVKRKSEDEKDEGEDSARPIFLEEGLAAVLAALSTTRLGFKAEASIDGDVLNAIRACTHDLEVAGTPGWAWRRTIVAGFDAMRQLEENGGGVLTADLDARTLTYAPLPEGTSTAE